MGNCLASKKTIRADLQDMQTVDLPDKPPLKWLKLILERNLKLDEQHHFTVFARYHFWNSYRRSLQMCQKNYLDQLNIEE